MATLSGFGYDAGVEVSIRGIGMAISEDTAAIVAATLTAAHCSANNPFARDNPKSGDELRDAVLGLFEHYQKAIRKDGVIYSPPPE